MLAEEDVALDAALEDSLHDLTVSLRPMEGLTPDSAL